MQKPTLANTGERLIPDQEAGSWNYDVHLSRYRYAAQSIQPGCEILDYGCGTGYGIQYLSQLTTGRCVGVDKPESVEFACYHYPATNLCYERADIVQPSARYGQFDLIVSFDVIEHVAPIEAYLENIAAQLRNEQSIAVISTPWSYRRNNLAPLHNEFHLCELTTIEFHQLLDKFFTVDEMALTLGMFAKVRPKQAASKTASKTLHELAIALSGGHVIAIEHEIERLNQTNELAEASLQSLPALSRWITHHRKQLGNRAIQPEQFTIQGKSYLVEPMLDPVLDSSKFCLSFTAESANLSAIDLFFRTYQRINGATLRFELRQKGMIVGEAQREAVLIQDAQPTRFLFPAIPHSAGQTFELCLYAIDGTPDNTVGLWCDPDHRPIFALYYRHYQWQGAPSYRHDPFFLPDSRNQSFPSLGLAGQAQAIHLQQNITDLTRIAGDITGDIADDGERVTHLYPNTCYQAHLSIYHFALTFCQDQIVLDAGCGAGYGSNYLAEKGAKEVWAIDVSHKAIAFSQQHFKQANLHFQVMDLQKIEGFTPNSFGLIFSSNALEHVAELYAFFQKAHQLLRQDGTLLIAVPPITNAAARQANLANPYHLNIWSPKQWHHTIQQFFQEVTCYQHNYKRPEILLNFHDTPEEAVLKVEDFYFPEISIERLNEIGAITAIFVARTPRPQQIIPTQITYIDDSFTRLPATQPDFGTPGVSTGYRADAHMSASSRRAANGSETGHTNIGRVKKAVRLMQTKNWAQLRQEVRDYIRWKIAS